MNRTLLASSKVKAFLRQPLLLTILFCSILISGEAMGGFYLFYIMLGLPHLVFHSVLGVLGILLNLLPSFVKIKSKELVYLVGVLSMIISLVLFFTQTNGGYNYETFHLVIPLIVLILFVTYSIAFIVINVLQLNIKT